MQQRLQAGVKAQIGDLGGLMVLSKTVGLFSIDSYLKFSLTLRTQLDLMEIPWCETLV